MKSVLASAKYKGDTNDFVHGKDYMIEVANTPEGEIVVNELKHKGGDNYTSTGISIRYVSTVSFLIDWDDVHSYPTISL